MIFSSKAREEFDVKSISSSEMENAIAKCGDIYRGRPHWVNADLGIKTVNFAKFVCQEVGKLATLGMSLVIEGDSPRVKRLQEQMDVAKGSLRDWVEYAGGYGTIILKPNGDGVDCYLPDKFTVTDKKHGRINGAIFVNQAISPDQKKYYTRLEYHRFIDGLYVITNRCFVGMSEKDAETPIVIEDTPWKGIDAEVAIKGITEPLFAVLSMPSANSIDVDSPLSLPVFENAIEELRDLDVAYSRNASEIFDSEKIVLMDESRLLPIQSLGANGRSAAGIALRMERMKLPKYVRAIDGLSGDSDLYHEINPSLNTEQRLSGINALLSQIGFKCGFSNGYFVFNQSTGLVTATQVTADQARTIQLIEDVRKKIDACIIQLVKALNVFEDLYGDTGHIEILDTTSTTELDRMIHLHFEPIYTNKEEDRMRALQLTNSGYYPKWYYLHMWEGLSEEEAKALTEEAAPKETGLFAE